MEKKSVGQVLDKSKIFFKTLLFNLGHDKEARLILDGWKNYLRFKVFIRPVDKNEKSKVAATVPLNKNTLYLLVDEIRKLADKKEEYLFGAELLSPVWEDDKMTDNKEIAGYIYVGKKKDKNGDLINFISVKDKFERTYAFKFGPTPYVRLNKNGKPLAPEEESNLWAKSYSKLLESVGDSYAESYPDILFHPDLKERKLTK